MQAHQRRNKKTLTNELNVDGSSDNRRLNTDVIPVISPSWSRDPNSILPDSVNLGSSLNPWRTLYADKVYAYTPRIPLAVTVSAGVAPSSNPTANGGFYWTIDNGGALDSAAAAARKVYRWNSTTSAWDDYTSSLTPGSVFFVPNSSTKRILIWAGARSGNNFGLRQSFQFT